MHIQKKACEGFLHFSLGHLPGWLLLMILFAMPAAVNAQFTFTTNNGSIAITGMTLVTNEVVIPDTINGHPVTSIGDRAFYDYFALYRITIPNSITNIGHKAFAHCTNLTSAYFQGNAPPDTGKAFAGDPATIYYLPGTTGWGPTFGDAPTMEETDPSQFTYTTNNDAIIITGYTGPGGAVVIPDTINGLLVTRIGDYAFLNRMSVTNVIIPDSVTSIGNSAFFSCFNLSSITMGNNVTCIGPEAFFQCVKLTGLVLPNSLATIGYQAFTYCSQLTGVTFPESVTNIGSLAFRGCYSLTNETIPDSVISIGSGPFADCASLTNITVSTSNPAYSSVNGVLFDITETILIQYPNGLTNYCYVIPNGVTTIGDSAFYNSSLSMVVIPNSVVTIGAVAFGVCWNLTSVTLPDNLQTIEEDAFYNCFGLTNIVIPASVTGIGDNAFGYSPSLATAYFEGDAPPDDGTIFSGDTVTVYYLPETTGWGPTFGGAPTIEEKIVPTSLAPGCTTECGAFVASNGSLWLMGDLGSLGIIYGDNPRPQEIDASGVTSAALGGEYLLFTKSDGSVWGMGNNDLSGLGIASLGSGPGNFEAFQPMQIPLTNVVAVAAGFGHSLFVESDGSLWAVGDDGDGQLGDGAIYGPEPDGPTQPEKIVPCGVTKIAAGSDFSLFIKSDGSLWAMGDNGWGQLGDGTFEPDLAYSYTNLPEEIVSSNVTAIAAGAAHSLFLKSDGSLWAMGKNLSGQLGDGTHAAASLPEMIVSSNVTAIAAGAYFSLFLKSDGSLWAMGDDSYGQLGDNDWEGFWPNVNQPEEIVSSNVIAIAAGQNHSLFVKSDGSLWGMGEDDELGDGFITTQSFVPLQIYPTPQPILTDSVSSGTNLQFTATCGFGGNFYLLTSTNLTLPLCQWTPVWTNNILYHFYNVFSATLPAPVNPGQQFYILQSH